MTLMNPIAAWCRTGPGAILYFPDLGPLNSLLAAQRDPRAIDAWEDAYRRDWRRGWRDRNRRRAELAENRDWSIPLGPLSAVAVPINVYPAKFRSISQPRRIA